MKRRVLNLLHCPVPFAWKELQRKSPDPDPNDLYEVACTVKRGSRLHKFLERKILIEMGDVECKSRVNYPTLLRLIAVAIHKF